MPKARYHRSSGLSVPVGSRIIGVMSHAAISSTKPEVPFQPFHLVNEGAVGPVVLLCDHASNALPAEYGTLGLPPTDLERHIGWDVGAADVTRRLADLLQAPAVLSGFSRLLIDPNRAADDPTLVMKLSDGAIIPGNRHVTPDEVDRRRATCWQPYHDAVTAMIDRVVATGESPLVVSLHSFTPVWRGHPRPWHSGVLWDKDHRLPHALLSALRMEPGMVVGDNEPYKGQLRGDTMYRHGTQRGLPHSIIEIRQDLIDTHGGAQEWAERLARILLDILKTSPGINAVEFFGSHTDDQAKGAAQ